MPAITAVMKAGRATMSRNGSETMVRRGAGGNPMKTNSSAQQAGSPSSVRYVARN